MAEIEPLLEPIDDSAPSGPDLRLDPGDLTFQTLKEYTTTVDASVAADEDDVREPNWNGVTGLCHSATISKSKDLELIANLAGGWVRTEGITAVHDGLELLLRSMQTFWDSIHPGVDPDDGEISLPLRARWLNWMDAQNGFLQAVKQAPVAPAPGGGHYTWLDFQNSALLEDATLSPERHAELVEAGVVGRAQWESALSRMDPLELKQVIESLGRSLDTIRALAAFTAEKFDDDDRQDFFNLRELVEEIRDDLAKRVVGASPEVAPDAGAAGAAAGGSAPASGGAISNRQEALRQLEQIGRYFLQTEPHSPISYLINRAVRWGSMPLDQLIRDVVRNDEVIGHVWETLGLDRPGGGGGDDED